MIHPLSRGQGSVGGHGGEGSYHYGYIQKGVDVERVDQMLDVETPFADVENFQDERKQRNAAKHHHWDVVPQGVQEKLQLAAVLANLVFYLLFYPRLEGRFRAVVRAHPEMDSVAFLWFRRSWRNISRGRIARHWRRRRITGARRVGGRIARFGFR